MWSIFIKDEFKRLNGNPTLMGKKGNKRNILKLKMEISVVTIYFSSYAELYFFKVGNYSLKVQSSQEYFLNPKLNPNPKK